MAGSDNAPDSFISKEDGLNYWEGVSADIDGMLGGIPSVKGFSGILKSDLQGSRTFLAKLGVGAKQGRQKLATALEGGAGIGRVTEGLLIPLADEVDVIEPVAKFTAGLQGKEGVRNVYNHGLQDWEPVEGLKYDLIWTQWCVGHLTDSQLVEYLRRCQVALNPGAMIVLKENLSTSGRDVFDELDSSVTRRGKKREDAKFRQIFEEAGLQLVKSELQRGFPETPQMTLLPVRMYALKPKAV
ncbi:alpha N-terminal protein methyltransferase 1 [Trichoderma asperellum]|uniref:Alpha N-terminal protein methyltransferase 1 n=1 Tax=Trichoderma asperellum TaxID=101201 RepID=A0A6V8QKM1_TRIAP|nr:alpha N-terminal protein methyltransferase 1 [Trichoderma asperellum]